MKKLMLALVAALSLAACGDIYWPGDTRVVAAVPVHCSMFGYHKYDETIDGCAKPEGTKVVGGLFVKQE